MVCGTRTVLRDAARFGRARGSRFLRCAPPRAAGRCLLVWGQAQGPLGRARRTAQLAVWTDPR